jgi:hypothetical protein
MKWLPSVFKTLLKIATVAPSHSTHTLLLLLPPSPPRRHTLGGSEFTTSCPLPSTDIPGDTPYSAELHLSEAAASAREDELQSVPTLTIPLRLLSRPLLPLVGALAPCPLLAVSCAAIEWRGASAARCRTCSARARRALQCKLQIVSECASGRVGRSELHGKRSTTSPFRGYEQQLIDIDRG